MEQIAPTGPIYQAGTLSGNPIAMSAGIKTLQLLSENNFHADLHAITGRLLSGLEDEASKHGVPLCTAHAGGMFGVFFTDADKVTGFDAVMKCNTDHFKLFFHSMLNSGIYLAPSAFEAGFSSAAHTNQDIDDTVKAAGEAFAAIKEA